MHEHFQRVFGVQFVLLSSSGVEVGVLISKFVEFKNSNEHTFYTITPIIANPYTRCLLWTKRALFCCVLVALHLLY